MIDLKPTYESCIMSTLLYLSKEARKKSVLIITFDQPLYWKALSIMERHPSNNLLNSIVLRLGGFHTPMSFLGCVGHVVEGSGIENALVQCFAPNTIPHIKSGKAYSRALRALLLMDLALHAVIMSE